MFIVGYPRSGNTWFSYLMAYSLNAEYDDFDQPGVHPRGQQRQYVKGGFSHASFQAEVGQVLKTHGLSIPPTNFPTIYLVRDGRDVMASYYFFKYVRKKTRQPDNKYAKIIYNKLHLRQLGIQPSKPTFSKFLRTHTPQWVNHAQTWLSRNPSAIVRYEDLRSDPVDTLQKIMRALEVEIDTTVIYDAVELFQFKRMAKREAGQTEQTAFFRKGVTGDWQNHFTEDDTAFFSRQAGGILTRLGYSR